MTDYHLPPCPQSELTPITTTLSDFRSIRKKHFLLVDKTACIHTLLRESKVFLSRPHCFGKSLLLSTIKELFTNGTKNFEGLAIHDLWDRPCCPVVSLSLFGLSSPASFEHELCARLRDAFAQAGFADALKIQTTNFVDLVPELNFLHRNSDIVLLIDDVDFPLSANINNRHSFELNKEVIRKFYAWLRDLQNIEFLMITGVGRYHDSSLFMPQDIKDISLDPRFASLLGYTQEELESYFASHISAVAALRKFEEGELLELLKRQYGGYCFDYDAQPVFGSYWQESSNTASVLRALLNRKRPNFALVEAAQGSGVVISQSELNNAYASDDLNAILTQTGYLTIKQVEHDSRNSTVRRYSCSFPNQEIDLAFGMTFFFYVTNCGPLGAGCR